MLANEFRIGNNIERVSDGLILTVTPYLLLDMMSHQVAKMDSPYKPIEISQAVIKELVLQHEIEERIGGSSDINWYVNIRYMDVVLECEGLWEWGGDRVLYLPHIKYLHQLQNIFFDLTNKELKVQECDATKLNQGTKS